MRLQDLQPLVTPQLVSLSLDTQLYESLTYDEPKNAHIACRSAARWCYSFLGKYGRLDSTFSADDKAVLSEAMTQMAIYELLLISQFDENGDQYKTDAEDLLHALLGISTGSDGHTAHVGGAIAKDEKSHLTKSHCSLTGRRQPDW